MTVDMDRRIHWCDGWPATGRGHACAKAGEYRLHVRQWEPRTTIISKHGEYITMPAGERDSDEGCWLCNDCAALMCATHVLDRQITRAIQVCEGGFYSRTEHRPFGIWREYRSK